MRSIRWPGTCPAALGVIIGVQIVTRVLYWRFGPRWIVVVGLLMVAMSVTFVALVTPDTNLWLVYLIMLSLGFGIGCVFIPSQAMCMATITKAQTGRASSIFNAGKQLSRAIGVALLSTVLAAVGPIQERANHVLAAFHGSFLTVAVVSVITVAIALTIHNTDAATTMVRLQRRGAVKQAEDIARIKQVR